MNNFFDWIGQASQLLFVQKPEYLLTFVGVGMGIVIFSLGQTVRKLDEALKIKSQIINRKIDPTLPQFKLHVQVKNQYWKFVAVVEKIGVLYFASATMLAFLITYPYPVPPPIPTAYKIIANLAYLMLLIPTLVITMYYIYYRLRYRLH
jgi:hypothetical protein